MAWKGSGLSALIFNILSPLPYAVLNMFCAASQGSSQDLQDLRVKYPRIKHLEKEKHTLHQIFLSIAHLSRMVLVPPHRPRLRQRRCRPQQRRQQRQQQQKQQDDDGWRRPPLKFAHIDWVFFSSPSFLYPDSPFLFVFLKWRQYLSLSSSSSSSFFLPSDVCRSTLPCLSFSTLLCTMPRLPPPQPQATPTQIGRGREGGVITSMRKLRLREGCRVW